MKVINGQINGSNQLTTRSNSTKNGIGDISCKHYNNET